MIFANSVLGARTVKHPDFFDLFVALTGRAPLSDVYLADNRQAQIRIRVTLPAAYDDAIWPLIGWLSGQIAPGQIPLIEGLEQTQPNEDDLKGLCAAFGTTSAAPLLHIRGITPEGDRPARTDAVIVDLTPDMMAKGWKTLNAGPDQIDLVALGSPHFSLSETRRFTELLDGRTIQAATVITLGRATHDQARAEGLLTRLQDTGVRVVQDLCWCSITEPVFPPEARHLITNSGKYAHYAPGLCGRSVRFAGLESCATAAVQGHLALGLPDWLT